MNDFFLLIFSVAIVNNFVLVKFLGLCPFVGASGRLDNALGLSLATSFVLTLAAGCSYLIDHYLLTPMSAEHLRTLSFILVIAVLVQLTEAIITFISPLLQRILGIYLPLITSNCAVLGVALLQQSAQATLVSALLSGLGAALGFSLVLLLFAALRERLDTAPVPELLRGSPIALLTAGIMALSFVGLSGLDR